MSNSLLQLKAGNDISAQCLCLLIIPAKAIDEPGYIKPLHSSGSANKHELQALAQTAYYQLQDDELQLEQTTEPVLVGIGAEKKRVEEGMVLLRDEYGAIRAVVTGDVSARKLLETANRFCTRWVRLDI
jgi:hypothetical protein